MCSLLIKLHKVFWVTISIRWNFMNFYSEETGSCKDYLLFYSGPNRLELTWGLRQELSAYWAFEADWWTVPLKFLSVVRAKWNKHHYFKFHSSVSLDMKRSLCREPSAVGKGLKATMEEGITLAAWVCLPVVSRELPTKPGISSFSLLPFIQ